MKYIHTLWRYGYTHRHKIVVAVMLFLCFGTFIYIYRDTSLNQETPEDYSFSQENIAQMKQCLSKEEGKDECFATLCEYEPGYLCAEDLLKLAVVAGSTKEAMQTLHTIMGSEVFAINSDGHLLSHIVGRETARLFGVSGESFLLCPSNFNNGCFHGFFEYALPRADSPVAVAVDICESMPADTPPKEKSYCYHGAGHVFMMNESHFLDKALAICLSLPDGWDASCWQGVFMENAGEREWELKKKNFREDEPLYPCTVVDDMFKPECYINHHGYLIRHYSTDWNELIQVCRGAGEFINSCLGGLGLMLSSEYWTQVVVDGTEGLELEGLTRIETVAALCTMFPTQYQTTCIDHVVPGFLNFDVSMVNVSNLCMLFDGEEQRTQCFKQGGRYLKSLVSTQEQLMKACASVPAEYHHFCID